jgi:hypothetical protein
MSFRVGPGRNHVHISHRCLGSGLHRFRVVRLRRIRRHRAAMVACHDGRQQRGRRPARQGIQREPERIQSRAGLQGDLSRDAERRHRGLPLQAAAGDHPGVRRRQRRHDGRRRRHRPGRRSAAEGRLHLRQVAISRRHRRLLFAAGRHHAVLPLQLVLTDPLLQQGRLHEGGPRCREPAQDLAGGLRGGQEDQGQRRLQMRYHLDLADLDPDRELRGLEQCRLWHERERARRQRREARIQRAALRGAMAGAPRRPSSSSCRGNARS